MHFGKVENVCFLKIGITLNVRKLELIHIDLWKPSLVACLGGSSNYFTFIDDSSRNVWVYFLKNEYDVFETFNKWKTIVDN